MGLLNKCILRFDRVFWPAELDWIDYLGPQETLWADWTSYLPATGQPLIVGFNAAAMANAVEGWDDRETAASALDALRAMFGTSVPDPVGCQISAGGKTHSRGALIPSCPLAPAPRTARPFSARIGRAGCFLQARRPHTIMQPRSTVR
ncbi:MAG: FAD-dependent oxidoreductase [Rhodobacteraceae bacterium]|nr:FAD-dependent oxidoreductase [Paracoccaceae bacterium]